MVFVGCSMEASTLLCCSSAVFVVGIFYSCAPAEDARSARPRTRAPLPVGRAHPHPHPSLQVELKNLNSFRAVQESVDFEIVRQAKCVLFVPEMRHESRLRPEKEAQRSFQGNGSLHNSRLLSGAHTAR